MRPGTLQETPACSEYYTAVGSDTCSSIRTKFNLSAAQFYTLNPGVYCDNLVPNITTEGGVKGPGIGHQVSSAESILPRLRKWVFLRKDLLQ